MAITTVDEIQSVLGIKGSEQRIEDLIPLVEKAYLGIRNKAFDTDDDDNTIYPVGSALVAIEMIAYHMQTSKKSGVASESLGDHSISFLASDKGYPASITGKIKRFAKFT